MGYALAHPSVADVMNRVRQPFNVNSIALRRGAPRRSTTWSSSRAATPMNLQGLRQLEEGARALGLEYIPSHGNFITVQVGKAAEIYKRLLRRGVIVRPVGGGYGLPEHLRVTWALRKRTRDSSRALAASLKELSNERVAVIGVGLIGGSFALALKQAKAVSHGGRRRPQRGEPEARARARRHRLDRAGSGARRARRRSGAGRHAGRAISGDLRRASQTRSKALITDGGSTKRDVIAAARKALGGSDRAFVPGAPDRRRREKRRRRGERRAVSQAGA